MLMTKGKEVLDRHNAMPFLPGKAFMMNIGLDAKSVCIESSEARVIGIGGTCYIPYKRFVKAFRRRKEKEKRPM